MNYLERLVSRALATPRAGAQDLFDPFERVAQLPLTEPAAESREISRKAGASAAIALERAASPSRLEPTRPAQVPPDRAQAASVQPQAGEPSAGQSPPSSESLGPGPARAHPIAVALRKADGFMHAMAPRMVGPPSGLAPSDRQEPTPAHAPFPQTSAGPLPVPDHHARPVAPPPPPHRIAAPAAAEESARPRPVTPPVGLRPEPPRAAPPPPSPAADSRHGTARPPAGPARQSPPERRVIVSRSGTVSPERAHNLNIVRFGIGQV